MKKADRQKSEIFTTFLNDNLLKNCQLLLLLLYTIFVQYQLTIKIKPESNESSEIYIL